MVEEKKSRFQKVLTELGPIAGVAGIGAGLDYICGGGINHPFEELAFGSGFAAGMNSMTGELKPISLYTSLSTLAVSLCPNVSDLISTGDFGHFVRNAAVKGLVYGAGLAVSGILGSMVVSDYNSIFDVDVTFRNKNQAGRVYEMLETLRNTDGLGILEGKTRVKEPIESDGTYRVTAKFVGRGEDLKKNVRPQVIKYITEIVPLPDGAVSEVIIGKK